MMKQIAGTINLDRVKEASSFSSDIYSLWVWNSPQAAAPAQASSRVQVLRRLIGRYPGTSYYDRLGFILCCYIKFTVMMALYSKWRITALCYFPSDIQSSPGYYCTDPSVLSHFVIFQQNSKRIKIVFCYSDISAQASTCFFFWSYLKCVLTSIRDHVCWLDMVWKGIMHTW